MSIDPDDLDTGAVVIIAALDDIPEHSFVVHSVEDDCVTGIALTGPLAGSYGEPPIELIVRLADNTMGSLGSA